MNRQLHNALILLICGVLLLYGCTSKSKDGVVVKGQLQGYGTGELFLYGFEPNWDRVDTIPVVDGLFEVTLPIDTTVVPTLVFEDNSEFPLFIKKSDHLDITGSADRGWSRLIVKGGEENHLYYSFLQKCDSLESDSIKRVYTEKFIEAHPESLVSLYLVQKIFVQQPSPNYEKIEKLIEPMVGELKDRPGIEELLKKVEKKRKHKRKYSVPYFSFIDSKGESKNRTFYTGQYLLLHYWASWDSVSTRELTGLRKVYKKYRKRKDYAQLSISLDTDSLEWKSRINSDTLSWTQACSFDGWEGDMVERFTITSLPTYILIDTNSQLLYYGENQDSIQVLLTEIFKNKP